jgi:hypothetical protein
MLMTDRVCHKWGKNDSNLWPERGKNAAMQGEDVRENWGVCEGKPLPGEERKTSPTLFRQNVAGESLKL